MSYKQRAVATQPDLAVISHKCPAHGCPNAAAVSLDFGARWACFAHAKAAPNEWPAITQKVRENWPETANWNHPAKVAHDAEQSAKRRAALPKPRKLAAADMASVADLLESRV